LHRLGLDMPELVLENGSGLSREEKISAASLAQLLQVANSSPVAQAYIDSLPIAGVDGTMRRRLTNAAVGGNAHIKTGTLRDVRAIAGYVGAANGDGYIVVSFINDPRAEGAREAHDALLEWVYQEAPLRDPPTRSVLDKNGDARNMVVDANLKTVGESRLNVSAEPKPNGVAEPRLEADTQPKLNAAPVPVLQPH
jgi:D-alanyl-D-alanine carboxypeptidase/D-alanyl-D-alanine-endopeptidase (penicillin-binding protein 4)